MDQVLKRPVSFGGLKRSLKKVLAQLLLRCLKLKDRSLQGAALGWLGSFSHWRQSGAACQSQCWSPAPCKGSLSFGT